MKILMVIPTYEPIVGGAERQLQGIVPELVNLGHEVTVVTRHIRGTASEVKHESGYLLRRLPTFGVRFGFHFALMLFLLFRVRRYDVFHCHTLAGPAHVCSLAASVLRRPLLLKITRSGHGSQIARLRDSPFRAVIKALWSSRWVRFAAITSDTLSELLSFGVNKDRCTLIPNGVQAPTGPSPRVFSDSLQIIYTGRLIARKRVGVLLSAFAGSTAKDKCRLTIIGDGPLREDLQTKAAALDIASAVAFTGELDHGRLQVHLSHSDIFVLPSDSEGMSNSLLEAMAHGLTVIATDIDANRELIVSSQNGLLFGGEDQLQSQLDEVASNAQLRERLGKAARQTIVEGYSFGAIAYRYAACYRGMVTELKSATSFPVE